MSDAFYSEMADIADELLTEFSTGTVVLVRRTRAAGAEIWTPGARTETRYDCVGAVAIPAGKTFVGSTTVVASDTMVVLSPRFVPEGGDSPVALEPTMDDRFVVRGRERTPKQMLRVPDDGPVVVWKIALES